MDPWAGLQRLGLLCVSAFFVHQMVHHQPLFH